MGIEEKVERLRVQERYHELQLAEIKGALRLVEELEQTLQKVVDGSARHSGEMALSGKLATPNVVTNGAQDSDDPGCVWEAIGLTISVPETITGVHKVMALEERDARGPLAYRPEVLKGTRKIKGSLQALADVYGPSLDLTEIARVMIVSGVSRAKAGSPLVRLKAVKSSLYQYVKASPDWTRSERNRITYIGRIGGAGSTESGRNEMAANDAWPLGSSTTNGYN